MYCLCSSHFFVNNEVFCALDFRINHLYPQTGYTVRQLAITLTNEKRLVNSLTTGSHVVLAHA